MAIGRAAHIPDDESVLCEGDRIDLLKFKPVGRLAGDGHCRVTDCFEMVRPPSRIAMRQGECWRRGEQENAPDKLLISITS